MGDLPESSLFARARQWVEDDPDPDTARELQALIDARNLRELRERLSRPLTFGTAGLRGLVGAGPSRMNRAVVVRTTRALALYLLSHEPDARTLPVVLGFDARLSSRGLARAAAGVLAAARIPVRLFADPVPTPLVAYATRALSGSAGIVITASHNPAEYNGYKLYGKNGVQVIPPVDEEIERRTEHVGPARTVPSVQPDSAEWASMVSWVPDSITARYLSDIDASRPRGAAERALRIVYTPLHGVGAALAMGALAQAGFEDVSVVPEQAEPDGRFPTVRFPNPEEPGALDLALSLAKQRNADLVLANDPDADRLAVCVRSAAGRFIALSGNQIGVLLADFLLESARSVAKPLVISSIVSTPMLADIAEEHGARAEVTLTGFKWIWSAASSLEETSGVRFVFGFEEAIGFSVCRAVRDKDGISAALLFAELAARCRAAGQSVLERLRALYVKHGLWVSIQHNVVRTGIDGAAEIAGAVDRIAASPPETLGGMTIRAVKDFRHGEHERPFWLASAPLVLFELEGGRALLRPSGTEPKLKIYVDLRGVSPSPGGFEQAEAALRGKAATVGEELAALLGF